MPRMIDQIRANKLPSNMMQFAARGALQVPAAENIEILVHLARHNKVFGDLARMTLAGWDEKSSRAAAGDPGTSAEVLNYMISGDNVRPALLPALLDNPSVPESDVAKLAVSAMRETIEIMLKSERVRSSGRIVQVLRANPYLKKEEAAELVKAVAPVSPPVAANAAPEAGSGDEPSPAAVPSPEQGEASGGDSILPAGDEEDEAAVSTYLKENESEIAAEGNKPFQSIGGVVELLGQEYFPVTQTESVAPEPEAAAARRPAALPKKGSLPGDGKRMNALQKINSLDVKGRIQLALKGNKEERSLLIRDGTKVVALAVLEAPKLSDGEVEKFASQKNVLEAVLRQIPLKRRFMKNYIVVRNLVANPRTPLDLGLGLMKHLLPLDLKNISGNKDISETVRKLALKMYKQKVESANKK